MQRLKDKVAVVTGASSGIGDAAVRMLVADGAHVILSARRADRLAALAEELGPLAHPIACDVGDLAQVRAMFDEVKQRFGGVDLLFNNAGVGYKSVFAESDPEHWRAMMDTNVYGMFNCTHAALPLMRGRDGAMVATVSSIGGRYGLPALAVYSATKAAVVTFSDALRRELGERDVRVTIIEPGAVWSEWGSNLDREVTDARRAEVGALHGEDVARAMIEAFVQPPGVHIREIRIAPTRQVSP